MPIAYIADTIWRWIAETGINLALLILIALLIPRAGRFANRVVERRLNEGVDPSEAKTRLAIANVGINVAQIIAFFLVLVFFLQQVGFSLAGAAIPATVVSAAIGFGAQSIIADFLAGFFILTEKQYGVGDVVTFEGNGVSVSGTVIQITMRSTYIRTIEESTVSIPNSTARICINQSNYWSSAMVIIPVPLLSSSSPEEAAARAEAAARRTLDDPEIGEKVIGSLEVHPAVAITPPTTVGMPWTMDVRFLVRVEAGSQWRIERAIRMNVLDEFWNEYGSAATMAGTRLDHVASPEETVHHAALSDATTQLMPATTAPASRPGETRAMSVSNDDEVANRINPDADPAADSLSDATADDESGIKQPRLAFNGTMRLSTAVLLGVFAVVLIARGLTLDPGDHGAGSGGVFAPPPRTTVSSTPEQTPEPAPAAPAVTTQPQPEPTTTEPTTPAPETTETNPTAETGLPQDDQQTDPSGAETESTSPEAPGGEASTSEATPLTPSP
ncbi:mechanosensitive ion channel family protein [Corynebacterium sp. LK2510]|uniref:mechanosensitive ion channel family protein n=1 Tax=Corynebacterium sp. LK2510 TaxID=3110472 RepID=UPI0034CF45EA